MLRIGLIGYFGAGAYSDDLIEHVTKTLLRYYRYDVMFDSTILSRGPAASDPNYLNSFDLLIHCGGSLLGKCTHYPIRDIAKWASKVKTKMAVFGIGYRYEPDKEPLALEMRERIRLLFEKAEIVTVRGAYTVNHLKDNGIDVSKISSMADPVMACDIPLRRSPSFIVGNVRDMPMVEIQHSSTVSVQKFMAECYDWLVDKYDLPLSLISFRHNLEYDNDVKGADRVISLMRNKHRATRAVPPNYLEAVNLMGGAKLYFGQRLHPTLFAAVNGIPFVGLEYQFDKMLDWVSTVGVNNVVHTRDATLDSFIEAYGKVEGNMEKLRYILPKKAAEIRETAKKIVNLV